MPGLLALAGGCRYHEAGVDQAIATADGAPADGSDAVAPDARDGGGADGRSDAAAPSWDPPPGVKGTPLDTGCSDGSREGFTDPAAWRAVAGCAGAWTVPGLQNPWARAPQCERTAGNHGINPAGTGCSIADLCAAGWHVCESGQDLRGSSPTECESAAPAGFAAFFVSRAGASPYGLCVSGTPDPGFQDGFSNDLHGCGSFGQPEAPICQPFDRRLSFVDCLGTGGIWACGDDSKHLQEADLVSKTGLGLGGALCCKDR